MKIKKREEFIEKTGAQPIENLIFLDESGANFAMTRTYGRILSSQRLKYPCPYQRGSNHSIISAISIAEVITAMYTSGSVNGEIFLHFLDNYLAPKLNNKNFVILDNVAFHKVAGVK